MIEVIARNPNNKFDIGDKGYIARRDTSGQFTIVAYDVNKIFAGVMSEYGARSIFGDKQYFKLMFSS